ncbi:acyltransferase family protein [Lacrimispora celerecrescens]|uniref:Acyltransferase 3 domain-containing protein n=1 Tax=Lacrimispora celerecrescens TaxID=29354 RepID=A0A084JQH0_9FIRM|nr:acyltransferase family protein [Lacrimispora celerecrescens]KEZ91204.1 hypothetical protein IO98_03905 [Lacrimispora celerecrescens]
MGLEKKKRCCNLEKQVVREEKMCKILSRAEQSRAEYIDIYRSFGIILMVMGHIGFGIYFDHFIHAFHMPMFFFISGIFFKVNQGMTFSSFVKKKAKTLLIPYAAFGLFHYFVWLVQHRSAMSLEPLKCLLFVNTDGIPIAGALWFLTAFFFAELIYFAIRHCIKRMLLQNISIVVISIMGCITTLILPFRLPYAMDASFVGVGLLHIGYLVQNNVIKNVRNIYHMKYYEWIILVAISMFLIFTNGYVNMRTGTYAIIPLFWINAILAIIIGINLSKYLERSLLKSVHGFLLFIGRNSIVYLCLNQLIILCVRKTIRVVGLPLITTKISIFVIAMILLSLCTYVIINTRLKVFLGK